MAYLQQVLASYTIWQPYVYTPFIQLHVLCNKCLDLKYLFRSNLTPMLVESRPFDNLWLQCIIRLWYEFPCECLDNGRRVDTMREEVVE